MLHSITARHIFLKSIFGENVIFLYLTLAVQVLTWAKQHEQRLETALTEVLNNANLLEELLSWLQWAETTLIQRDTEPLPQDIPELKTLVTEHQVGFPVPNNGDTHCSVQTNLYLSHL